MSDALPSYDPETPVRLQENDWDCSVESTEWALYAWGRSPDDNWLENSMIAAGVVNPAVGLTDASGAGLAAWCNAEYGMYGYVAQNEASVDFDALAAETGERSHPIMAGGRTWCHWTGVRGYDPGADRLLLANPAPFWMGIDQSMSRGEFAALGPFSMVRLTHPAAEGAVETPPIDYTPWTDGGKVGSGLISMMAVDQTWPAQRWSTWLPLGAMPADIEECVGANGVTYRWLLTENVGFRIRPS